MNFRAMHCVILGAAAFAGCMVSRVDTALPGSATSTGVPMAAGDLDGDGLLDLVVAHKPVAGSGEERRAASAMLSQGDGHFTSQFTPFSDATARRLLLEDFNGDGKLDMAVLRKDADGLGPVVIHLGHGDGTFGAAVDQVGLVTPGGLAAGDLDGDGKVDLVISDGDTQSLIVARGNGDGTFGQQTSYHGVWGRDIALGDLNGDGKLDATVLGSQARVLLNNGAGALQERSTLSVGPQPKAIAVADVDQSGDLDLVIVDGQENRVRVLRGNGNGTFAAAQSYAVGAGPEAVAVGDVDGNGHLDVVTANRTANTVTVLVGAAGGAFDAKPLHLTVAAGPSSVTLADVTGDGVPEVITGNQAAGSITVLRNTAL